MKHHSLAKKMPAGGLSSFGLHILGMALMLCDHMWATVIPGQQWMTWLGRLAYPIFAFMIVEGYHHTHSYKKYLLRLLIFALVSEIPFNLMCYSSWVFPFHQNVMWTFLLSLLCLGSIDRLRAKLKPWLAWPLAALVAFGFVLAGQLLMVDYYAAGVLTVLAFYLLRGNSLWHKLGQLAALVYINWYLMSGLTVPLTVFGLTLDIPQQGVAVLALAPIWLYSGSRGPHSKAIQLALYAFYPVHMLLLALLQSLL